MQTLEPVLITAHSLRNYDAVLFNNGLHGWHLDEEQYSKLYDEFLNKLINEFPNTLIIPILTTSVTNQDHNNRAIQRNNIVKELAENKKLPVIDLYYEYCKK